MMRTFLGGVSFFVDFLLDIFGYRDNKAIN